MLEIIQADTPERIAEARQLFVEYADSLGFDLGFQGFGEELAGPWSLQHPGRLSSFGDAPWVPTQWSTELLAARFESWFGLPGVAWLFGAFYLALVLAVFVVCRREGARLPARATGTVWPGRPSTCRRRAGSAPPGDRAPRWWRRRPRSCPGR